MSNFAFPFNMARDEEFLFIINRMLLYPMRDLANEK